MVLENNPVERCCERSSVRRPDRTGAVANPANDTGCVKCAVDVCQQWRPLLPPDYRTCRWPGSGRFVAYRCPVDRTPQVDRYLQQCGFERPYRLPAACASLWKDHERSSVAENRVHHPPRPTDRFDAHAIDKPDADGLEKHPESDNPAVEVIDHETASKFAQESEGVRPTHVVGHDERARRWLNALSPDADIGRVEQNPTDLPRDTLAQPAVYRYRQYGAHQQNYNRARKEHVRKAEETKNTADASNQRVPRIARGQI